MLISDARCHGWISYPRETNGARLEQAEDVTLTGKGRLMRRLGQRGTSNECPRFPPVGRTWPCADNCPPTERRRWQVEQEMQARPFVSSED